MQNWQHKPDEASFVTGCIMTVDGGWTAL